MCDSNMKCKTRSLFIGIALSFLFGCLSEAAFFIPEAAETPFGTLAETVYAHEYSLDGEEPSVDKHGIMSEINVGDALRHFSKTKRANSFPSPKYGLTFAKRNQILYASSLNPESFRRFPSGLSEGRRRLISFGKLII